MTELVKENTEENVVEITTKAFSLLPNIHKAIEALTKLKAVGPATASGNDIFIIISYPQSRAL